MAQILKANRMDGSKDWQTFNNWKSKVGKNVHECACCLRECEKFARDHQMAKAKIDIFCNKKMPIQNTDKLNLSYLTLK